MLITKSQLRKILIEAILTSPPTNDDPSPALVRQTLTFLSKLTDSISDPGQTKYLWFTDEADKGALLPFFYGGASADIGSVGENIVSRNSSVIGEKVFDQSGGYAKGRNFNTSPKPQQLDLEQWQPYGLSGAGGTFPAVDVCMWNGFNDKNPFTSDQMVGRLDDEGGKYELTLNSSELLATSVKFSAGFKKWPKTPTASPTINTQKHNFTEANCKELGFTCLANVAAAKLKKLYKENENYIKAESGGVENNASGTTDRKIVDFLKFAHLSGYTDLNDDLIRFWLGLKELNVIKKPQTATDLPNTEDKINAYANSDDVVDQIRNGTFIKTFSKIILPVSGYEQVILPHAPSNLSVSEAFNFPVLCAIRALPIGTLSYTVPASASGEVKPDAGNASLTDINMAETPATDIKAIGVLSKNIEDFLTNYKTSMLQISSKKSPAMGTTKRSDAEIKNSLKHKEGDSLITTNIKLYINMASVNETQMPSVSADNLTADGFAKVIVDNYNNLGSEFEKAVFQPLAKSISVLNSKFKGFMNSMGIDNSKLDQLSLNAFDLFRPIPTNRDDVANVVDPDVQLADLMDRPPQTGGFSTDSDQIKALISLITLIENAAKFIANIEDAVKRLRNASSKFKTTFTKLEGLVGNLDKDFNRRIYAQGPTSPYFILGADPEISAGKDEPNKNQRKAVAVDQTTRVLLAIEPFPSPVTSTSTSDNSGSESNLLSDFANILNLEDVDLNNNLQLKNRFDLINASIPPLIAYLNSVIAWLSTASQRYGDEKIKDLVSARVNKDTDQINASITNLINSLTYTDASDNPVPGLGDTTFLAQPPPEVMSDDDDKEIQSYNDLKSQLITKLTELKTSLENENILQSLTDLYDVLKQPATDDIIGSPSSGPIFPTQTKIDSAGEKRRVKTADPESDDEISVTDAYGGIFRDPGEENISKIIDPLKADNKTVTRTDDTGAETTSQVTRSGAEKVFSTIKFRTVITNIEYFVNVAETVSLTADQIFDLDIPNVSSEPDEEKKKAILELLGLKEVFDELQQKAKEASEDPNYVDQLQLLIANNPDAVSDIVAPKVIPNVVIKPSNSEALIDSFIQAIEIIDICFLAPPLKDGDDVLFSYFADDSKRVEQRERLTKIRQTFSGKGIVTEQSKRDRSLDGKAIELITAIAGFIKLALNAYTVKNVLDVYLDMTNLIINTENFIDYFEKLEAVYLELSDEQVQTDDIAKNNVINIQQFSKDQRSIDKKFDQDFDDSSIVQTKFGVAAEGRRLKMKYSLLDLLEEQMVPMPALGAGSAQYDSRRVEDPFDIDPRTMSLLGLLGAEEVDIKETDVDTVLDGIPNRLDDEDDTPQGFGDMMERFLRNTHQKEDSYKKEKQERQFGLSHAALLKKKYYGRY